MPRFLVRVTRSTDEEYADVDVEAIGADQAIRLAIGEVQGNPAYFFGEEAAPTYYVDPMDEPKELDDEP